MKICESGGKFNFLLHEKIESIMEYFSKKAKQVCSFIREFRVLGIAYIYTCITNNTIRMHYGA
jgi:hypothetical protein